MLVLVGGQKGGPGKSTAATNLAAERVVRGHDCLLYDMDEQRTSTLWASRRDENEILPRIPSSQKILDERVLNKGAVVHNDLKALQKKYEDIVVDAGGIADEALRAAMIVADFFLMPLAPSSFDLWTMGKLNTLIGEAKQSNKKLKAFVWFNKVPQQPSAAKQDIEESKEELSDYENIKILKASMVFRQAVKKSQKFGQTITEYKPTDKKAIEEMLALYGEVYGQ